MIIELTVGFLLFVSGFLLGRIGLIQNSLKKNHSCQKQTSGTGMIAKFDKSTKFDEAEQIVQLPKINIDERKFVTEVTTKSFQKDFENLGEKTTQEDDIGSSVSKLGRLKKTKN